MTNYKNVAIIILSIALAIVSYIAFKGNSPLIDNELAKMQLDALKRDNDSLIIDSKVQFDKVAVFKSRIDSLQKLKPTIEYVYDKKIKNVDNTNVSGIINGFNTVFTNGNVK